MNDRRGQILEATVEEFIDTGEPVSSGWLYRRYDFGIKPAMIRLELDSLEEEGYLEQPYHSAGRVPTDDGYEFYAGRMLGFPGRAAAGGAESGRRSAFAQLLEERAWPDLLAALSSELGLLGVVADRAHDEVYKAGLESLVNHLHWEDREGICSVIRDFETVDERVPSAAEKIGMDGGPQVFIGKKSPVTKSENLAVIGGNFRVRGGTVSIFAIGPKRMDYKRTIRLFKNLINE